MLREGGRQEEAMIVSVEKPAREHQARQLVTIFSYIADKTPASQKGQFRYQAHHMSCWAL